MKVYIVEKIAHSKMRAKDTKCGKKIRKWKCFPLSQTKKILYRCLLRVKMRSCHDPLDSCLPLQQQLIQGHLYTVASMVGVGQNVTVKIHSLTHSKHSFLKKRFGFTTSVTKNYQINQPSKIQPRTRTILFTQLLLPEFSLCLNPWLCFDSVLSPLLMDPDGNRSICRFSVSCNILRSLSHTH